METQREDIERLDRFDEVFGLEEDEIIERNKIGAELKRNMFWNDKFLFQKAKSKWLKEGDVNSKFCHKWINKRFKVNGIEGLFVNEEWVESKEGIRCAIFNHFRNHFSTSRSAKVQDVWNWTGNLDDKYTVKREYIGLESKSEKITGPEISEAFLLLWKSLATRRIQSIGWKILKMRLPTRDELKRRGIISDSQDTCCPCCELVEESVMAQIFMMCLAR
ncbi:hypothetical protein ACS0TY_024656 [Phlomoides rotata]